jgi:hypothetical protein
MFGREEGEHVRRGSASLARKGEQDRAWFAIQLVPFACLDVMFAFHRVMFAFHRVLFAHVRDIFAIVLEETASHVA